ncbi:hypothetical protein LZC95_51015 [Pendulispora brunnea]|uniref:Uncharacterized protein n=1 Tax=Pendulispora brunnea TaxID=2905690 RepID=A0ABZ2K7T4_9BACT
MNAMNSKTVGTTLEEDMLAAVQGGGKLSKPPSGFWGGVRKVAGVVGKFGRFAGGILSGVSIVSQFIDGFNEGRKHA